jgi:hypothetical protein
MTVPARSLVTAILAQAPLRFSAVEMAGDHTHQVAVATDPSQWIHLMTSRQSGKSWIDDGILLDNGLAWPGSTGLLLGLKGTGVKVNNWVPIWKRGVCERASVPDDWHNETTMLTSLPGGSRVMFAGTDDLSNVKKYLGNRLDHGVVIIDESQDQPDEVLRYILKVLLPPMLTPTSRVILSGVLPDVPAGYFYELAADRSLAEAPHLAKSKGWSHHEWARAANVHTPEAMGQLAAYLRAHGIDESDPQIQRDWYLKRVWDVNATAYRYEREKNGYEAEVPDWLASVVPASGRVMASKPWPGIDSFSVGIDPGSSDRTAVEVWGWGPSRPGVQHVFEWVSDRKAHTSLGQIASVLAVIQQHFAPDCWYWDPGSGKMELDTFSQDYGVPVIKAANKVDLPGQVRRNSDLLVKGWAKVMVGSGLEEDYQKARWDAQARAQGRFSWSSQWHPDPSEAARYALAGYFDAYVEPEPETPYAVARRAAAELAEKRRRAMKMGRRLEEDEEAAVFADGDDPWA